MKTILLIITLCAPPAHGAIQPQPVIVTNLSTGPWHGALPEPVNVLNFPSVIPSSGTGYYPLQVATAAFAWTADASGASTSTMIEAYANNGTLGAGTTFYGFTAPMNLTLHKLTATIYENGSTGSSVFSCGSTTNHIDLTINGSDNIGERKSVSIDKTITAGTEIICILKNTTQNDTPTVSLALQYSP